MDKFNKQLSRLPFMAALIVAVAGMPLDVYAYNQHGLGHAHSTPWLQRASAALGDLVKTPLQRLGAVMTSPQLWRLALPAATCVLMATGYLDDQGSAIMIAGLTVPELLQKKGELAQQARQILDDATAAGRAELNAEEEARFDAIHVDIDKLTKQIERVQRQDSVTASLGETAGRRTDPTQPTQAERDAAARGRQPLTLVRSGAGAEGLRSWLLAGSDQDHTQAMRDAAQRVGIRLDQRNLTIRMAPNALRTLHPEEVRAWEEECRAQNTNSATAGGNLVADEVMRPLEIAMLEFGGMRAVSTVLRTNTGADLPFPTSNDTNNEGVIVGENDEQTELAISFGQLVLEAYKYSSRLVKVSVELLQDSGPNVAQIVGRMLGERIGRITNRHFTVGTGTSQPKGIVTASTLGVTGGSPTAISYNELVDLQHSVDPAYRNGARWMFHDNTLKALKKLKDNENRPIWLPGLAVREPDTILGDNYTINQHMPTMDAGSPTAKSVIYGALGKYQIRDVRDITLIRLDERFAEFGQVAFLAFSRHDGDLLDAGSNPVKHFIG